MSSWISYEFTILSAFIVFCWRFLTQLGPFVEKALLIKFIFIQYFGAKLFYIFFSLIPYQDLVLLKDPRFWIFGGYVFYGALLFGVFLAHFKGVLDTYIYALAPAHAIGRVGCYINACCHGDFFGLPVQLIESFSILFIYFLCYFFASSSRRALYYLICYAMTRFALEFFREDLIRGIGPLGLSTSQWISLLVLITGLIILIPNKVIIKKVS